jgi:hypothetical protein
MSSTFSFILYLLVFLRLRGNIVLSGWYIAFRTVNKSKNATWRGRNFADDYMMTIARQMMLCVFNDFLEASKLTLVSQVSSANLSTFYV